MPLTIFNLSTVDHLYIGKDTVIAFAEQPVLETYNIELASEDKIKEHLAKPQNWVPQKHETLPEIPHDTAFLCSPADVPGPCKVQLQDKDITTDIRQKFKEFCDEYGEAFSKNNEDISRTKLVKMDIDAGDSPPVSSRPYTLPLKHYEWVQREIESLERAGVITKSMSKWASPIVIVPKKSAPGEPLKRRLCVDFRKVNELQQEVIIAGKTKGQISIHPLLKIDEMYAKLKGAKVFSTIDLRSGYHHIALGKSSKAKTAFVMPFGKYEFLMVPFGLAQAPAYFQLLMNKVLKGLKFAMTYLDDIIIFSQDESQHLEHLEIVFSCLWEAGLKMKHSKCDFFKSEIHYLGHLISPEGISPLPNKLDSIKHMPVPNSAKEIKQFLGLTGYYRKFVPRFADISRPLTTLTKKDAKFEWTSACQKSFELLKEALCGEPVLKYADTSKPYTLYTDASKYGWASVLTQPHTTTIDGKSTTTDHPVAFVSGLFRGSQLNWVALTKEAFTIYMSIKKLSFYLTDAQILLRSDHKPLEKFLLKNMLNSKVNNWAMELEAFNIQFDYIKGSSNVLADTLSRLISIDPDTPTTPEQQGYEFGYAIFEEFGGSIKILTDNGTEFKNKLFKEVVNKLGTEFSIHSPPYRPQSNGKIEGFHRFLKMCIGKHINYGLEWDELTPMATACYNFFPNCSARESAFFVMFERDPINKLNMLLHAARRYFHDDNGLPNLEALKNIYQVVAQQLLNSRELYVKKHHNQQ